MGIFNGKIDKDLHPIEADVDAMLINLGSQYKEGPIKASVVEETINSIIDAGATKLHVKLIPDEINSNVFSAFLWWDNGCGISDMDAYHRLGRISQRKSPLGLHGEGGKILYKKVEHIITETKSTTETGTRYIKASWAPVITNGTDGRPHYWFKEIKSQSHNPYHTGVWRNTKLKYFEDKKKLTSNLFIDVWQKWFSPILMGYYGDIEIELNGEKVKQYPIEKDDEKSIDETMIFDGKKIRYIFIKSDNKLPERNGIIGIVVHGKIIEWRTYEKSKIDDYLFGFIFIDDFRNLVLRSKSELRDDDEGEKKTVKRLDRQFEMLYSQWVDRIGGKFERDFSKQFEQASKPVGQLLYKVMRNDFKDDFQEIMEKPLKEKVIVESKDGTTSGTENPDLVTTTGKKKGRGGGTGGDDHDTTDSILNLDEDGDKKGEEKVKKTRVPEIPLAPLNKPDDVRESWMETETIGGRIKKTIVINTAHPSCVHADRNKKAREEHYLRCGVHAIARELKTEENELLEKYKEIFMKVNKRSEEI